MGTNSKPRSGRGLLMIFIAALLFSIGGLCVKMIPWQPLAINSFRSIISVGILLLYAKITRHPLRLTPGVFIGACAMCATTTFYTMANKYTTAANTILLQFTAPVFVIVFMWLIFRERPQKIDVIACALVFGGIACFFLDGLGAGNLLGNVLAVLSGVGYAGVFMLNKMPKGDPLFSALLGQAMGAVLGFPWLLREPEIGGTGLIFAVILGVFQLGIAYVIFSIGIQTAPPLSAALVTGIEPVLNPLLVALFLHETVTKLSVVGGGIVFATIMAHNLISTQQQKQADTEQLTV